eukprot:jgi/Chrzof1/9951/Cz04g21250.t1
MVIDEVMDGRGSITRPSSSSSNGSSSDMQPNLQEGHFVTEIPGPRPSLGHMAGAVARMAATTPGRAMPYGAYPVGAAAGHMGLAGEYRDSPHGVLMGGHLPGPPYPMVHGMNSPSTSSTATTGSVGARDVAIAAQQPPATVTPQTDSAEQAAWDRYYGQHITSQQELYAPPSQQQQMAYAMRWQHDQAVWQDLWQQQQIQLHQHNQHVQQVQQQHDASTTQQQQQQLAPKHNDGTHGGGGQVQDLKQQPSHAAAHINVSQHQQGMNAAGYWDHNTCNTAAKHILQNTTANSHMQDPRYTSTPMMHDASVHAGVPASTQTVLQAAVHTGPTVLNPHEEALSETGGSAVHNSNYLTAQGDGDPTKYQNHQPGDHLAAAQAVHNSIHLSSPPSVDASTTQYNRQPGSTAAPNGLHTLHNINAGHPHHHQALRVMYHPSTAAMHGSASSHHPHSPMGEAAAATGMWAAPVLWPQPYLGPVSMHWHLPPAAPYGPAGSLLQPTTGFDMPPAVNAVDAAHMVEAPLPPDLL